MTTRDIYVIRHGSLDPHEEDRIGGNPPLSAEGEKEVAILGKKLRSAGIEVIFHSDMVRAAESAKAIAEALDVPSYASKYFRSWNLGEMAGRLYTECQTRIDHLMQNTPATPPKGGESFENFLRRVRTGIGNALSDTRGVAIVTHYRVERMIAAGGLYGDPDYDVMTSKGEDPAHAERVSIDLDRLVGAGSPRALEGADVTGPKKVDWDD